MVNVLSKNIAKQFFNKSKHFTPSQRLEFIKIWNSCNTRRDVRKHYPHLDDLTVTDLAHYLKKRGIKLKRFTNELTDLEAMKNAVCRLYNSKIINDIGCFISTRYIRNQSGYPTIIVRKKRWLAHRLVFTVLKNNCIKPDKSLFVCHTCDNPSCYNPQHLFLGTAKENNQDKMKKGRHKSGIPYKSLDDVEVDIVKTSNMSHASLAKKFGVAVTTIKAIRDGKSYNNPTFAH